MTGHYFINLNEVYVLAKQVVKVNLEIPVKYKRDITSVEVGIT